MSAAIFWLIAAVVFGILEVMSLDFVLIMLAAGALAGAGAAALGAPLIVQAGAAVGVAVLGIFVVLFIYPGPSMIYDFLAQPMLASLPQGTRMIATGVITPFMVPIKVTLLTPGMGRDGQLLEKGIPASLVSKFLDERGIVVEKTAARVVVQTATEKVTLSPDDVANGDNPFQSLGKEMTAKQADEVVAVLTDGREKDGMTPRRCIVTRIVAPFIGPPLSA